jgi:glutathione S-transferase
MTDDTTLRIERLIDASPDAVFDAWTTRAAMERWYADGDDFVVRVTELDVRVGGRYRVEFGPPDADPYVEFGEYLEIDRPNRLAMTETLEGVDSPWSNTRVTVELHDDNGKTRLVLTHEGFPTTAHRDLASGGWPGFLDRIAALLA